MLDEKFTEFFERWYSHFIMYHVICNNELKLQPSKIPPNRNMTTQMPSQKTAGWQHWY